MAEEANGGVAPRTPPKDCTWGHRTGAIGGTNLKETHQQEARRGAARHQPPRETRAKYSVTHVEQWGMCIGTASSLF